MFKPRKLKKEKIGIRDPEIIECPSHRAFIRRHACAIEGKDGHICDGPIECAHARNGTDGGGAQKPSDFWCLPLCQAAHRIQHAKGETTFEAMFKISMKAVARIFAAQSPHKHRWLSIGRDPAKEGTDIAPRVYSTVERKVG